MAQFIHLISGPRNISTALMYSFGNRSDMSIIDEPYYGYYLQSTGKDHPGRKEVLNSMSTDPSDILDAITNKEYQTDFVFLKNMAHHLMGVDLSFIHKMKNVFLIRDPKEIIHSFSKVIPHPTLLDIGIKEEFEIYNYCLKNNIETIVLDSNELLRNPARIIEKLCDKLSIPFSSKMLKWKVGKRKEDGVWAKYWYDSVHKSNGFKKYESREIQLRKDHSQLYDDALKYYKLLNENAIKL